MPHVETRRTGLIVEFEFHIPAERQNVWRCWTEPELIKQWFCPKPWWVDEADVDVRPGGRFNFVMAGPDGERIDNKGSILHVVEGETLIFTDAYLEDFAPSAEAFMTSAVELSDHLDGGTRMTWDARHTNADDLAKHEEMGLVPGWTASVQQLEDLATSL